MYSVRPRNRGASGSAATSAHPKKYDIEFDFESSNARFNKEEVEEEVQRQMAQLAVEKGWTGGDEDHDGDEHEVNGNGEVDEQPPVSSTVYYNKSKSFFDSLSSDSSVDR